MFRFAVCLLDCASPRIVEDPLGDIRELLGLMTENFDGCGGAERVSEHGDLLEVEAVLPASPIDAFETARGTTHAAWRTLAEVGFSDSRAVAVVDLGHDMVCFFNLSKAQLNLGRAKFTIDTEDMRSADGAFCVRLFEARSSISVLFKCFI